MYFQSTCLFMVVFFHMVNVNENEKKNRKTSKTQNLKILPGDMVKRYLSTKCGINLLDGF